MRMDLTDQDAQDRESVAAGPCPYCGEPLVIVEIESADGGFRLERAFPELEQG